MQKALRHPEAYGLASAPPFAHSHVQVYFGRYYFQPMQMLIYVSSAVDLFTEDELIALLEKARKKNSALDITGMLLYRDGNFMQLLEGPKDAVYFLSETIRGDPRHSGFLSLLDQETNTREFAEWRMGYKNLSNLIDPPAGYSDFLNMPLNSGEYQKTPSKALKLLLHFKRICGEPQTRCRSGTPTNYL